MSEKIEKIERSINGSFNFKGEKIYYIMDEFFTWCATMEKQYEVTLLSNRADYSGYLPTDRTSVDKK